MANGPYHATDSLNAHLRRQEPNAIVFLITGVEQDKEMVVRFLLECGLGFNESFEGPVL